MRDLPQKVTLEYSESKTESIPFEIESVKMPHP